MNLLLTLKTKNKVYKMLFVIIFITSVYACKDKNSSADEKTNNVDTIATVVPEVDYLNEIKNNPDNFYISVQSDSSYIGLFCTSSDTIAKLWYRQYKTTKSAIDSSTYHIMNSIDWGYIYADKTLSKEITINGTQYILFSCSEGYKGASVLEHTVRFYALNKQNLNYYYLDCTGEYSFKCGCIDGEFSTSKNLEKQPLIKDSLYKFSKESKLIYQRTDRDADIYYHMNFEKKWSNDNGMSNSYAAGYSVINDTIYSTYYKTDLFELLSEGSSNDLIENDKYKIVNYFRNDIIGYDKDKELYFPIFIESCVLGCNKRVEFDGNSNVIIIRYDDFGDSDEYKIFLDNIIFDTKEGD